MLLWFSHQLLLFTHLKSYNKEQGWKKINISVQMKHLPNKNLAICSSLPALIDKHNFFP